jgi:DNA polymerase I-like protein with 3'-5' exonuclease and polymerase domains
MTQEEKIDNLWNQYDEAVKKGYHSYARDIELEIFSVIERMEENCVNVSTKELQ